MSNLAQELTRKLGGEWCGSYGRAPGPGHSKKDRSLKIAPHRSDPDDVVLYSFAGDDWQSLRDEFRRMGLLPDKRRHSPAAPDPVAREKAKAEARERERQDAEEKARKQRWTNKLWHQGEPAEGTVVEGHLSHHRRLNNPPLDALRYLPPGLAGSYPAMMAGFGLPDEYEPGKLRLDEVQGIHLTFLDGIKKAPIAQKKIMHGTCKGMPIVLAPPNDGFALCIGEGIETTTRLNERLNVGAWAAGSAPFMPALAAVVPDYIECVHIAVDSDEAGAGERHATKLAELLSERGIDAYLVEARHGV